MAYQELFHDLRKFSGLLVDPKAIFAWIFVIEDFIIDKILEKKHVKYDS